MRELKTTEAVGKTLCQDITQIIKGVKKGPVFRKGHVIREEDVPVLLSVGKDHIYIWEEGEDTLHENDAAAMLYEMGRSENMHPSEVKEGKIEFIADCDGMLKIQSEKLFALNSFGQMMMATKKNHSFIKKGEAFAGTRIIPLSIEREKMEEVKKIAPEGGILQLLPFEKKKVGLISTGNEVFYKRIQDSFTPVVREKLSPYPVEIIGHVTCPDDVEQEKEAILGFLEQGADLVICMGGMSVDPDDRTPLAIRLSTEEVVSYGAPVLPGSMFMLAYAKGKVPVLGLPGSIMFCPTTVFDLVLPRIMAGDMVKKEEIDALGEGGLL